MKKINIGIPGWKTGENSFGAGVNHLDFVSKFGNPRIIMPDDHDTQGYDMLYLPGGMDLNPASFGQVPGFHTGNQDVHKQYFFDHKLKNFVEAGIPIFGVCLGMQMLGVYFEGILTQDLPYHPQSSDRWQEGHAVKPLPEACMVIKAPFVKSFKVNSHHHQGFFPGDMPKSLLVSAISDDGIVEAFMHKELPIIGIQWHPEEWYDIFATKSMEHLAERALAKQTAPVSNVEIS